MNEFASRVNESISGICEAQAHELGERLLVFIPVPAGVDPELDEAKQLIDLDDVEIEEIEEIEDGKARAADGSVLLDATKDGAMLYRVTGRTRK